MSNLLASLVSTAGSLEIYGRVLETAQNNVANASTPGYAKQSLELYALPFDPEGGVTGGVGAGKLISARNEYSEQAVRQQTSGLGYQQQLVDSLTAVQSNFDISGKTGIPQALNNLFQSFSAWGATPDNQAARQTVVDLATDLAQSFQQASNNVASQAHDAEQQIGQTVDQVNQLVSQIQGYNQLALQGNGSDGGLSANTHAALEQLSTLVDVTATFQPDGTVNVMLNGQTPLLLGDKQYGSARLSTSRRCLLQPTPPGRPACEFWARTAPTSQPLLPTLNWARCSTCATRFYLLTSATRTKRAI